VRVLREERDDGGTTVEKDDGGTAVKREMLRGDGSS
jgi:hypothetical protein